MWPFSGKKEGSAPPVVEPFRNKKIFLRITTLDGTRIREMEYTLLSDEVAVVTYGENSKIIRVSILKKDESGTPFIRVIDLARVKHDNCIVDIEVVLIPRGND